MTVENESRDSLPPPTHPQQHHPPHLTLHIPHHIVQFALHMHTDVMHLCLYRSPTGPRLHGLSYSDLSVGVDGPDTVVVDDGRCAVDAAPGGEASWHWGRMF